MAGRSQAQNNHSVECREEEAVHVQQLLSFANLHWRTASDLGSIWGCARTGDQIAEASWVDMQHLRHADADLIAVTHQHQNGGGYHHESNCNSNKNSVAIQHEPKRTSISSGGDGDCEYMVYPSSLTSISLASMVRRRSLMNASVEACHTPDDDDDVELVRWRWRDNPLSVVYGDDLVCRETREECDLMMRSRSFFPEELLWELLNGRDSINWTWCWCWLAIVFPYVIEARDLKGSMLNVGYASPFASVLANSNNERNRQSRQDEAEGRWGRWRPSKQQQATMVKNILLQAR